MASLEPLATFDVGRALQAPQKKIGQIGMSTCFRHFKHQDSPLVLPECFSASRLIYIHKSKENQREYVYSSIFMYNMYIPC